MQDQTHKYSTISTTVERAVLSTFKELYTAQTTDLSIDRIMFLRSLDMVFFDLFENFAISRFGKTLAGETIKTEIKSKVWEDILLDNQTVDTATLLKEFCFAYESIAEKSIVNSTSGAFYISNHEKKDKGVYFTPVELADSTCQLTLLPLLNNINSVKKLLEIKILDPSCGTGVFIIQALRIIEKKYIELGGESDKMYSEIVKNCLFGVDINPITIRILKAVICLESQCVLHFNELSLNFKCGDAILGVYIPKHGKGNMQNISYEKHDQAVFDLLGNNYKLTKDQKDNLKPFCWELEFPKVFSRKNKGFNVVIGNPPWGKIKPMQRFYFKHADETALNTQGDSFREHLRNHTFKNPGVEQGWIDYQTSIKVYSKLLKEVRKHYSASHDEPFNEEPSGDSDYYKFFIERIFNLVTLNGRIGFIIPASFSNNAGAAFHRNLYISSGRFEHYYGYINKKRIFPIHPMFRFLQVVYQKGPERGIDKAAFGLTKVINPLTATYVSHDFATINFLNKLTGGFLMIPEIADPKERALLEKLYQKHHKMGEKINDGWNISFNRELDMTLDSNAFLANRGFAEYSDENIPLIEGRMVNQFDHKVKAYESGTARKAVWNILPLFNKNITPQYFVKKNFLNQKKVQFTKPRVGFCDISGHQNERTLLAAVIPGNVVCSNKVPTCTFADNVVERHQIWAAYANSFTADWIIRRWVSTTLNFFYFKIMPFPRVDINSELGNEIINLAKSLTVEHKAVENPFAILWERAQSRARIDAIYANIFELEFDDISFMMKDFALLDRYQKPLDKELNSTVTSDLFKLTFLDLNSQKSHHEYKTLSDRIARAKELGAIPYLPSSNIKFQNINDSLHTEAMQIA